MNIMSQTSPKVNWDYTEHAAHYDKRSDYSYDAIKQLLTATGCTPKTPIAEVGAGTGKLTKELLKHGLTVKSVEPNDAMRAIGIKNTQGQAVTWSVGTGEATGLPSRLCIRRASRTDSRRAASTASASASIWRSVSAS